MFYCVSVKCSFRCPPQTGTSNRKEMKKICPRDTKGSQRKAKKACNTWKWTGGGTKTITDRVADHPQQHLSPHG